jgi:hypothetical protein
MARDSSESNHITNEEVLVHTNLQSDFKAQIVILTQKYNSWLIWDLTLRNRTPSWLIRISWAEVEYTTFSRVLPKHHLYSSCVANIIM